MRRTLFSVLLGVCCQSWLAQAGIVFTFTGSVTQVPIDGLTTGIQPGSTIAGSFTFDSAAPDLVAAASTGSYQSTGPAFGFTATIGGVTFSEAGQLNIGILNSFVDQYAVTASSTALLLEIFLQDNSGAVFSSDGLPLNPPPLPAFDQREFHLDQTDAAGNETQVDGTIDTLTCANCTAASSPEPASAMLLFTSSLFLGWLRRAAAHYKEFK